MDLAAKFDAITRVLLDAKIPFAFGGAIALNFYAEPRTTHDLDINVFLPPESCGPVLDLLERLFPVTDREKVVARILRDGQVRLLWVDHYVDLFFQNVEFLEAMASRVRQVEIRPDEYVPIISAEDLILCKASFNRNKDWFDIRTLLIVQGNRLDYAYLRHWMAELIGNDGEPAQRLLRYFHDYRT